MKFVVLAALVAVAAAAPMATLTRPYEMSFEQFKASFNVNYATPEEEAKRADVFAANLALIRAHNADASQTYKMGVNQFADLTQAEFKELYLAKSMPFRDERNEVVLPVGGEPNDVDWRTKNAVTPVKNQGQCGSCWSFSTTGSVEGAWAIKSGNLVSLSEQQLCDCSRAEGNMGCNGGLMDDAFQYIIKNGGIDTEADYPYTARDGTCNAAKAAKHVATITGFTDVPKNNANQMVAALNKGPVSVAIEADQAGFQMYHSGVFSGPCGTNLDHGVLAVGYSDTYWIVKNSWGETWGDQGYILMSRSAGGAEGLCGILMQASYPEAGAPGPSPPPPPPGPSPPPPPPGPASYHYEDPKQGCQTGEEAVQITGISGDFCSPECGLFKKCPTDVPPSTTARPECVLEAQGHSTPTNCALICTPGAESDGCPENASCKPIQGTGLCTYDD